MATKHDKTAQHIAENKGASYLLSYDASNTL